MDEEGSKVNKRASLSCVYELGWGNDRYAYLTALEYKVASDVKLVNSEFSVALLNSLEREGAEGAL